MGQRINELGIVGQGEWTGYTVVGQRINDGLYWDREDKSTGYSGTERIHGLIIMGQRMNGQLILVCCVLYSNADG